MEENLNKSDEISMRTMDSDLKALEWSGGEISGLESFTPNIPVENKGIGTERPFFQSAQPSLRTEMETARAGSRWWKIIGIIILVAVLIVGFGFLGYYVISHWIFPSQMPAV